jgi:hypothetical protein
MKTKISLITILLTGFLLTSCDIHDPNYDADYTPPNPPTGVVVVNGNNQVDLYWNENRESDVAGYNIYFNFTYEGKYTLIGSSPYANFIDDEALNGQTYYYAITAYDYNGNESELSTDVVYSTPRPDGFNKSIYDYRRFPNNSGYSFANRTAVPYNSQEADFFFENYYGDFYLDVWDDTDIQDMGATNSIYDIEYAPVSGWSETKDEFAIVGHTYVIWTVDNHFAKIRISSMTNDRVVFDWAYQLVEGNVQLKRSVTPGNRGPLDRNWERQ